MFTGIKSIRQRILIFTISMVFISLIAVGGVSSVMSYNSMYDSLKSTLGEAAKIAAGQVDSSLEVYRRLVKQLASTEEIISETLTVEQLYANFLKVQEENNLGVVTRTDKNGLVIGSEMDLSSNFCFQKLEKGEEPCVSDMTVRTDNNTMSIFVSAAIMRNGEFDGIVMIGVDSSFLCDMVSKIAIGQNGMANIIDRTGTMIAHKDINIVTSMFNAPNSAKTDSTYQSMADIDSKRMMGETGFGEYSYGAMTVINSYMLVPKTNGWSIEICASKEEFMAGAYNSMYITCGIVLLAIIVVIMISMRVSGTIAKPITACANRINMLSRGDISTQVEIVKTKDETGLLTSSTAELVDGLRRMIEDQTYLLGEMAKGNFVLHSKARDVYVGGFAPMLESLKHISRNITGMLRQINDSADQVAVGSAQVMEGAMELSDGATEQAREVEQLSTAMSEISSQIKKNAENAMLAKLESDKSSKEIADSNFKMQDMMKAMSNISEKSSEIGKIIKTIDDIAFQTNILALNAAVEAARAGEAGKGFAVVADEVRNLASKSAEAAQNTSVLIEESLEAVQNGASMANQTATSMSNVVESSKKVMSFIEDIDKLSKQQESSAEVVVSAVEKIYGVASTTLSTSEESSATSQELTTQAKLLKSLVDKFEFKGR